MWGSDSELNIPDASKMLAFNQRRLNIERRLMEYQRNLDNQQFGFADSILASDPQLQADRDKYFGSKDLLNRKTYKPLPNGRKAL